MATLYPNQVELTIAQILSERPSVRRFYNADNSNLVGDGVVLFDASINAGSRIVVCPTADWTAHHIGKLLWIEGAGPDGTADLLSTIVSVQSPTSVEIAVEASFSVENAELRYGSDCTTGLQNAFDAAVVQRGLWLGLPRGLYLTTNSLQLRSNLNIEGDGHCYSNYNGDAVSVIMCCSDVPVMTANTWGNGSIRKLSIRGTKRSGSKGIYTETIGGARIKEVSFDHFGDQALHMVRGIFGIEVISCTATGSCYVREREDFVGVFDFGPTDLKIRDCEIGASFPHGFGGEYGDGKIAALALHGADNSWVVDCILHHSQIGAYVGPEILEGGVIGLHGSNSRFRGVRTDHNQGHGFVVDASAGSYIGCLSFADGQDLDGTYDAYHILKGSNQFSTCTAGNYYDGAEHPDAPPTLYNRYKYVFHTLTPGEFQPNHFQDCVGGTATEAMYYHEGDQKSHCVAYKTNQAISGRRTHVLHGDLLLGTDRASEGWLIFKTADENALTDEHVWAIMTNYGPGYKNLQIAMFSDDGSVFANPVILERDVGATMRAIRLTAPELFLQTAQAFIDGNLRVGYFESATSGKLNTRALTVGGGYIGYTGVPDGYAVFGGFVGIGSETQIGSEKLRVYGNSRFEGTLELPYIEEGKFLVVDSGVLAVSDTSITGLEDRIAALEDAVDGLVTAVAALDTRVDALEAGGDFVTVTQHNAHDHFYTGDGSGTVSDHTSTANPSL